MRALASFARGAKRYNGGGRLMMTLPNILTLSRIVTVPLLVALLWFPHWAPGYALGFGLYCLMGVTDYFDGYLARAQGAVSRLGQFLDQTGADELIISMPIHDIEARLRSVEIFAEIQKARYGTQSLNALQA